MKQIKNLIGPALFSLLLASSCTNTDRGIEDKGSNTPAPQNQSSQYQQDTADDRRKAEIHGADSGSALMSDTGVAK